MATWAQSAQQPPAPPHPRPHPHPHPHPRMGRYERPRRPKLARWLASAVFESSAGSAPPLSLCAAARCRRCALPPRHLDPPSWLAPHMFEFDGSASYVLKRQARALTALEGDTDRNRFLVASLELRDANELQVLDFNEDTNEVVCMRAYTQPHETWHMASCPAPEHVELVTTVYSTGTEQRAVRPRPRHPHHPHRPRPAHAEQGPRTRSERHASAAPLCPPPHRLSGGWTVSTMAPSDRMARGHPLRRRPRRHRRSCCSWAARCGWARAAASSGTPCSRSRCACCARGR